MHTRPGTLVGAGLLAVALVGAPLRAAASEVGTVEAAADTLAAFRGIPAGLLDDARGVAIIPNVLKAGFVVGGRFGHGVVLLRQADGGWSNPLFIAMVGGGIGWQIGVQSTDVILIFRTSGGLERFLRGKSKLTLGADIAVAAGPLGRQAEASTDAQLKAEIYSYSRSRGLFAGVSVEGAGLLIDYDANQAFYRVRGGHPADVVAVKAVPVVAANLVAQLTRMTTPPAPPPVVVPAPVPPAPPVPYAPPASRR